MERDMVANRLSEIIASLRAERHVLPAALLAEAKVVQQFGLPTGVIMVTLGFVHSVLLDKWNRGENRQMLEEALHQAFGGKFSVVAELVEGVPRSEVEPSRREVAVKRQRAQWRKETAAPRPEMGDAQTRLQAAWLSARIASETAACLLGSASRDDAAAAVELYEMSIHAEVLAFRVMVRGREIAERIAESESVRDTRRSFNKEERQLLYQAAGGLCESCGIVLGEDWHADHRHPYSKGGPTRIVNGAALCASCNLSKGAKLL